MAEGVQEWLVNLLTALLMLMLADLQIVVVAYPIFGVNPTHHVIQGAMAAFKGKRNKKTKKPLTLAQQQRAQRRKRRATTKKWEEEKVRREAAAKRRGNSRAKKKKTESR